MAFILAIYLVIRVSVFLAVISLTLLSLVLVVKISFILPLHVELLLLNAQSLVVFLVHVVMFPTIISVTSVHVLLVSFSLTECVKEVMVMSRVFLAIVRKSSAIGFVVRLFLVVISVSELATSLHALMRMNA